MEKSKEDLESINDVIEKMVKNSPSDFEEAKDDVLKAMESKIVSDDVKNYLKTNFIDKNLSKEEYIENYDRYMLNLLNKTYNDFKFMLELFIIIRNKEYMQKLEIKEYNKKESLVFEMSFVSSYDQKKYYNKFIVPCLKLLNIGLGQNQFKTYIKKQYKGDFEFYKNNNDDFSNSCKNLLNYLKEKLGLIVKEEKPSEVENISTNKDIIINEEKKIKIADKPEKIKTNEVDQKKVDVDEKTIPKDLFKKYIRRYIKNNETENILINIYKNCLNDVDLIKSLCNMEKVDKENLDFIISDIKEKMDIDNKIESLNKRIIYLENIIKNNIQKSYDI